MPYHRQLWIKEISPKNRVWVKVQIEGQENEVHFGGGYGTEWEDQRWMRDSRL